MYLTTPSNRGCDESSKGKPWLEPPMKTNEYSEMVISQTPQHHQAVRPLIEPRPSFMKRPQHLFPNPNAAPYQPPTGVSKIDNVNSSRPLFQPKKKKRRSMINVDQKKGKKEVRFQLAEDEDEGSADEVQLLA